MIAAGSEPALLAWFGRACKTCRPNLGKQLERGNENIQEVFSVFEYKVNIRILLKMVVSEFAPSGC
jgi:hypothetical protein